ncbi:MAG: preprotein translocase subunit SecA [Dehalococcoidia bacterium]|nr:preprotein translocase subunit SecA [Dehalococcoidia bacterium]MYD28708.1 preprotein translocase subunit SecA [Dehalococcoidia bacterium]
MARLGFINRVVGGSNEREVKRLSSGIGAIEDLAEEFSRLSDEELGGLTKEFRERLAQGETLDDLAPEAFATVREMAWRKVEERPYPVQLMGGMVLHQGKIAEMKTGEGKTLTAIGALYLNALAGKGAHLVTVNDYLARRDAAWYGPVFHALGMTLGVIQNDHIQYLYEPGYRPGEDGEGGLDDLRPCERRDVYRTDVTYGTNNEFGFDYLRDNMVRESELKTQRPLFYAIVDEVDNILIDEARTPLIISGQAEEASGTYQQFARAVRGLHAELDYQIDQKAKHVALTETGIAKIERALRVDNVFGGDPRVARHLEAALDAEYLKRPDREYVVRNREIVIVDEFTGRMMPGRRWSHGIHQAVEAKENVPIQRESLTYATITFQNYFRLYEKLAGMTGTAETEAEEFAKIYDLDVVVIPTNMPMVRDDQEDVVYINEKAKFAAVVEEIVGMHGHGRPVLVGTTSIEKSEYLATLLRRRGIDHEVLNAKQHEREAHIVENAGEPGAVVIATNMAGRGTDIKLGEGVANAGGLHVIGTERHESRRIDNQLRGRSGRQGDPGSSRFFVSFGDDIMQRFAPDWVPGMLEKMGMTEDLPLESRMVTRAIEQAQQKVEGYNFDIRKRLVEFDDVINEQRAVLYTERDKVLEGADVRENVFSFVTEEVDGIVERNSDEGFDASLVHTELGEIMPPDILPSLEEIEDAQERVADTALDRIEDRYEEIEEAVGEEIARRMEQWLLLESIDYHWRQHLTAVEEVRQSVGLQAYAQVDPLVAFKREGYDMFQQLQGNIRRQVAQAVFKMRAKDLPPAPPPNGATARRPDAPQAPVQARGNGAAPGGNGQARGRAGAATATAPRPGGKKIGRNDPCYCGSGIKYKKCCGKLA